MADKKNDQVEKVVEEVVEEAAEETPAQPEQGQQVRLSFEGVKPEYANFCTLTMRQGEVFMSFGKAFVPTNELKVDSQIVMSLRNVQQLHQAMGRLIEQQPAAS
jgi:Protein of unknown function (DUF3467)